MNREFQHIVLCGARIVYAGVFITLWATSGAAQVSELRMPSDGDNGMAVFDDDLKEYLVKHNGRMPWIYPDGMSVKAVGNFPSAKFVNKNNIANNEFRIFQILDKQSALIKCIISDGGKDGNKTEQLFQLKNMDFGRHVDGQHIGMFGAFTVSGTYRYTMVNGASKTIFSVEPFSSFELQKNVKSDLDKKGVKNDDLFWVRPWEFKNGGVAVDGRFVEEVGGTGVHGGEIHLNLQLPGQQNHRHLAPTSGGLGEQLHPVPLT